MLEKYEDDAEIITFNRTSKRWFKTGNPNKIDKIKLYLKMLNFHNIFYYILS